MKNTEIKLRKVLKVNMVFSFITGLLSLAFEYEIAELIPINDQELIMYIGISLISFSTLVGYTVFAKNVKSKLIKFIIIQDILWVIGSAILIILQFKNYSAIGNIIIVSIALIGLILAILQNKFLKNL